MLGRFRDTGMWVEPQTYTQIIVCALTAFAESLYRYNGTDLFKVESDKGVSLKSIIDSQIAVAYPRENTGIGNGSIRVLSFGHGCTRNPSLLGKEDYFLVNGTMPVAARKEAGTWYGVLEVLYRRTRDPAYAWFLSQSTTRDDGCPGAETQREKRRPKRLHPKASLISSWKIHNGTAGSIGQRSSSWRTQTMMGASRWSRPVRTTGTPLTAAESG
jgi:hypothetical protein